jgi:hypothetical protein
LWDKKAEDINLAWDMRVVEVGVRIYTTYLTQLSSPLPAAAAVQRKEILNMFQHSRV